MTKRIAERRHTAVQGFEPLGYSDERPAPARMLALAAQAALDERGRQMRIVQPKSRSKKG
ncbi:MAG: hypothetical protein E5W21_04595 [Mesorhizobium sp.]|nr:MAG: hypothetical protein E5W21_04595 [Mesorhizobium sp.]